MLHSLNTVVHIAGGALAMLVGIVPLATAKGGRWHRRAGRVFVPLAVIAATTAVVGVLLSPSRTALAAITLSACYQLAGSLRALALRDRTPTAADAALALLALGLAALVAAFMAPDRSLAPAIGYSALGFVGLVAIYDLARMRLPLERWCRVRPLDHGLKMTGFYFAMVSAGAGNLLRDAQPWSGAVPSALGTMLMAWFALRHRPRRRPAAAGPEAAR